ncbi:MAG: Ig-like domain-containing protein [Epsilonproteobacteria bacterium]|nr:Ig-like domain-containing protein [Campylobacterota bacterium]
MKYTQLKQTLLILGTLFLFIACGGDGKNGAASNENLLSEDYIFIDPIYPIVPPKPEPSPSPTNTAPVADAGDSQDVKVSTLITLDGSGSYDIDDDPLTYAWTLLEKPTDSTATLSNASNQNPTFLVDKEGHYKVELIVNDGKEDSVADFVYITLNAPLPSNTPPIAIAGRSQKVIVHYGQTHTIVLDGRKSHDDGLILPLSYTWSAGKYSINKSVVHAKPSCTDDWQRCYNADQRPICSSDITLTVFDGEFTDTDTTNLTIDYSECEQGPVKEIDSIHLAPAYQQTIPVTKHKTYKLWVYYKDLTTEDVTKDGVLSTSDTSIATINAEGVVTGIAPGNVLIKASYKEFKDTAPLTVVKQ